MDDEVNGAAAAAAALPVIVELLSVDVDDRSFSPEAVAVVRIAPIADRCCNPTPGDDGEPVMTILLPKEG